MLDEFDAYSRHQQAMLLSHSTLCIAVATLRGCLLHIMHCIEMQLE